MQDFLSSRLKQTGLTLVALAAIALAGIAGFFAFTFATVLFFLGSTGRVAQNFLDNFDSVGYFAEGAFVCGGVISLLNAIVSPKPLWLKSIAASALGGGLGLAINPTLGHRLTVLLDPVFALFRNLNG